MKLLLLPEIPRHWRKRLFNEMVMKYFDKETANDKIEYLLQIKENVNEAFLEIVAQSLDFVENPGSVQERFDAIVRYLKTLAKFETGRLR